MATVKRLISKYFGNFAYFYHYLGKKIFVAVILNIAVGLLDGFGLAMFLPLLQMSEKSSAQASTANMGNFGFFIKWLESNGITLTLLTVLAVICVFFLVKGIANYQKNYYQVYLQQLFIKKIRLENLRDLKTLEYKYFITADVGRIQNTLTGEVDRVARAYQSYFQAFQHSILVAVYMGFAFLMDWKFAILVSFGGLITNFLYTRIYKNTKGASAKLTIDIHYYQGLIIQAVSNFKYLKASGQLKTYTAKLEQQVEHIEDNNRKIGLLGAILNSSREPLIILVVCLVIFIQTRFLGSALSAILISLLFFYRALGALMQMQISWNGFLAVSGSLENMSAFELELKNNQEKIGEVVLKEFSRDILVSDMTFQYGDSVILKNISLKIGRNETVAFVGESGSGKTTLVNLISGLLSPSEGDVAIDGIPRDQLNLETFQRRIGYITQDPAIFSDTIYNNVTFWAEPTPENIAKFNQAISKAAIADFVAVQPLKEQTELGNNGINLSGGQKQRISIARELFKDIDILILDEATSALDSDTEKSIQENIDQLKGSYTILIVAHRLSTIKNADRIVLLDKGSIADTGSFGKLVETSPYFRRMVELQELV